MRKCLIAGAIALAAIPLAIPSSAGISTPGWNSIGWTPIDTGDVTSSAACVTQQPWHFDVYMTQSLSGIMDEKASLVKPAGKCAERFYATQVSVTDDAGPTSATYSKSGATSVEQFVGYGAIPPIEVQAGTPSPDSGPNGPAVRGAEVTFEAKTSATQGHWTCIYSIWLAATGVPPAELYVFSAADAEC